MKINRIKKTALVLLSVFACHPFSLNAQIHYIGLSHENATATNHPSYGIEYQNLNSLYNLGLSYSFGELNKEKWNKTALYADLHLLPFHHACLKNRLVPFLGLQVEKVQNQLQDEGFIIPTVQYNIVPKTGLKLSFDRFIGSVEYQYRPSQSSISAKLIYAFWIRSRCIKKRIDEINAVDFSQF